jgi:hypothetical protein
MDARRGPAAGAWRREKREEKRREEKRRIACPTLFLSSLTQAKRRCPSLVTTG